MYSFVKAKVPHKAIISMSECSLEYAKVNLPFDKVNGIPVKHLSWSRLHELATESRAESNNEQKHLLEELKEYLGGIMTMQTKDSNWVYVVVLSSGNPENCDLTWIEIVKNHNKYFHPLEGNGWPKEPPNYIAFRYHGKLQAIHHIDDYVVTRNLHDEVPEMPDVIEENNYFVYKLGSTIIPSKEVKNGKLYPNGRVWAMLVFNKKDNSYRKMNMEDFTLGNCPYIMGVYGSSNERMENKRYFERYCREKLLVSMTPEQISKKITEFAEYIKNAKDKYRNPAAHKNAMTMSEASDCLDYILEIERILKIMLEQFKY